MNNFNFNNQNGRDGRRPIVALVIAVLVVLGVIGISNASYQNGMMQGMLMSGAQGTQIVVPNANGDGTQVIPAPAAPRAPAYGYGYPNQRGFGMNRFGGFGILGGLFHILLIGGIIFFVSRLLFRGMFGWRRWGGPGGWGGRGFGGPREPWGRGPWGNGDEDRRNEDAKPDQRPRDGDVI